MIDDPIDDPIDETYEVGKDGRDAHLFLDWPALLDCPSGLQPGRYWIRRVWIDRRTALPTLTPEDWGVIEVDSRGRWHLLALDGSVDLSSH